MSRFNSILKNPGLKVAVLPAVFIATAAFYTIERDKPSQPTPIASDQNQKASFSDMAGQLEYGWQTGKSYEYEFSREIRVDLNGTITDTEANGVISFAVLDRDEDSLQTIVRFHLKDKMLPLVGHDLSLFAKLATKGEILELRFDETTPILFSQIAKDILAAFVAKLPNQESQRFPAKASLWNSILGNKSADLYLIRNSDPQGHYLSKLGIHQDDGGMFELHYEKENYTLSKTDIEIIESQSVVLWDNNSSLPVSGEATEEIRLEILHNKVHSQSKFSFQYLATNDTSLSDVSDYTKPVTVYNELPDEKDPNAFANYKAADWDELQRSLDEVTDESPRTEVLTLAERMSFSFKADPSLIDEIKVDQDFYKANDVQFPIILGALNFSGSAEAQRVVRSIYNLEGQELPARLSAIHTLALTDEPLTEESVELLDNVYNDPSSAPEEKNSAALALAAADKNESNQESDNIINELWSSSNNDDKILALTMIGNTGDVAYYEISVSAFAIKHIGFKTRALSSLRFMEGDEVSQFILDKVSPDHEEEIQLAATSSLSYRPWHPTFLPPMADCVREKENTDNVRMACARVMLKHKSQRNEMRAILGEVASAQNISDEFTNFIQNQSVYKKQAQ